MNLLDIIRDRPIAEALDATPTCPFAKHHRLSKGLDAEAIALFGKCGGCKHFNVANDECRGLDKFRHTTLRADQPDWCPGVEWLDEVAEAGVIVADGERRGHLHTQHCVCRVCDRSFDRHTNNHAPNVWYTVRQDNRKVVVRGLPADAPEGAVFHCAKCDGPVVAAYHKLDKDEPFDTDPGGVGMHVLTGRLTDNGYEPDYRIHAKCEACGHGGYTKRRPRRLKSSLPAVFQSIRTEQELAVFQSIRAEQELAEAVTKESVARIVRLLADDDPDVLDVSVMVHKPAEHITLSIDLLEDDGQAAKEYALLMERGLPASCFLKYEDMLFTGSHTREELDALLKGAEGRRFRMLNEHRHQDSTLTVRANDEVHIVTEPGLSTETHIVVQDPFGEPVLRGAMREYAVAKILGYR